MKYPYGVSLLSVCSPVNCITCHGLDISIPSKMYLGWGSSQCGQENSSSSNANVLSTLGLIQFRRAH